MNLDALFKITYGVYIVSSQYDNKESGFISNTVMQVTATPIQFALCAAKSNYTTELIRKSKKVALSALSTDASQKMIGTFGFKSGRGINKFAEVDHTYTRDGVPVVTQDAIAWFEGHVISELEMETHILFIISIDNSEMVNPDKEPMTYDYYRKIMKGKAPQSAPTYQHTNFLNKKKEEKMENTIWVCDICGYEYNPAVGDPDSGIAPGTAFEDIPDDWVCPLCGVDKSNFSKKQ